MHAAGRKEAEEHEGGKEKGTNEWSSVSLSEWSLVSRPHRTRTNALGERLIQFYTSPAAR